MIHPQYWLRHGHLSTIYASQFRKVKERPYVRCRLELPDGDFIDGDWVEDSLNNKLVILSHGLEGSSRRPYVQGMINGLVPQGYDALAWNYRGCSGESNRLARSYHAGVSDDLQHVISWAFQRKEYQEIVLVGFSMGGNITLKYAGEQGDKIDPRIQRIIAVSVPLDLAASGERLNHGFSKIYTQKFLRKLIPKIYEKKQRLKDFDFEALKTIKTLKDFDNIATAPLHGFRDADDYYKECSSKYFLKDISVPTMVINASDDPFLGPECYLSDESLKNKYLLAKTPRWGGHVSFMESRRQNLTAAECWAVEFVKGLENKQ